ncbi:type II toxin-antitoxin system HicA family toxin [Arcticibacter eurypsychrophilus]|uniref:type II toxin-antitoxin system HicA family toxin n=1 Tax=Arcticibacter eurypsychrophilus TaxID=1434752 RepID=UPI00084DB670
MSKAEKLIERFKSVPADFTWAEIKSVLGILGFEEIGTGKTSGSRCRFINSNKVVILLHKPHPGSIVKKYAIVDTIHTLEMHGII